VVIIDDVGPLIAATDPTNAANVQRFKDLFDKDLKSVAGVLSRCDTVWVIGDLRSGVALPDFGDRLEQFARVIAEYCNSAGALAAELGEKPEGLDFTPSSSPRRVRWVYRQSFLSVMSLPTFTGEADIPRPTVHRSSLSFAFRDPKAGPETLTSAGPRFESLCAQRTSQGTQ